MADTVIFNFVDIVNIIKEIFEDIGVYSLMPRVHILKIHIFYPLQTEDPDAELEGLISSTTPPRLLTTHENKLIDELCQASEGMVVCSFQLPSILVAVATHLSSYYCFNFFLLEHMLLGQCSVTVPLSVKHVVADSE